VSAPCIVDSRIKNGEGDLGPFTGWPADQVIHMPMMLKDVGMINQGVACSEMTSTEVWKRLHIIVKIL